MISMRGLRGQKSNNRATNTATNAIATISVAVILVSTRHELESYKVNLYRDAGSDRSL